MPETLQLVSSAHPFAVSHDTREVAHGSTIAELIGQVQPNSRLHEFAVVYVNGDPIPYEQWPSHTPREGDHVLIQFVPMGGGGGKDPLRTILTIGLLIVTAVYAPALTSAIAGAGVPTAAASVISSGIFLVGGNHLINAIAPIRQPVTTGLAANTRDASNFFLDDARNRRRAFGAIPMVLGRHRVVPPLAAKPSTEVVGDQHFLRMMVCWGHGVLNLEELKIGETPIDEFSDVQIEHREGRLDDEPHTLYTTSIEEQGLNVLVQEENGWITRVSDVDADELSIDFVLPQGLGGYDTETGDRYGLSVRLEFAYRKVGTTEWLAPDLGDDDGGGGGGSPPDVDRPRGPRQRYGAASSVSLASYDERETPNPGTMSDPGSTDDDDPPGTDPGNEPGSTPDDGEGESGRITISDNRHDAIRHGFRWRTPERAQYEVRVRRVTPDNDLENVFNEVYWLVLRTITDRPPVDYPYPLATTALSIRASDQLHGSVEELNAIATSEVLDWNGSAWVLRPTSNPASLFRHVLQMPARLGGPARDRDIDLPALQRWHAFCEQNGYEYNAVRDYHASVWDTLSDIAAVARASPIILENGKWSVVVDDGNQRAAQVVTPRNSSNFRAQRHFEEIPHGLRIRFANRNRGWMYEERLVFRDNYNETNATSYATIDAPGITDPDHVYKFGRFHLAQLLLRREQWHFDLDAESLVCRRGSRVLIGHDVLVVGEAAGRIKDRTTDSNGMVTEITLDTELETAVGVDYGIKVRLPGNVGLTIPVSGVTNENGDALITFVSPASSEIEVGALVVFGTRGEETLDGLVTNIQRGPDLSATVTALPWSSPGVYNAETGPIPAYDPGFGDPAARLAMTITRVRSDASTREQEGGVLVPRILIEFAPVANQGTFGLAVAECQIRPAGDGEYAPANIVRRGPGTMTLGAVEQGVGYDIRLRWNPIVGDGGPWAEILNHVVSVGVFGFPGDGARGLSGYSSIITRSTLVGSAAAADTDTEWHLSGGRGDWSGARTLTVGGIDDDERDRLSRTRVGTILTIYSDADNWADYLLASEVVFSGSGSTRVATIELTFVEEVGTPPVDGSDMALHFSPEGTVGIAGAQWHHGTGIPSDTLGEDGDFYLRTSDSSVYEKSNGTWTKVADLSGADGATWHTGTTEPAASLGEDGDWYFRTGVDAAELYRKDSGAWVKQFDIDDGADGTIWHAGEEDPDTLDDFGAVGDYYFQTSNGYVYEKTSDSGSDRWTYRADITGPQGVPGVRGLAGYANSMSRNSRVTSTDPSTDQWQLSDVSGAGWPANPTLRLGAVTSSEEALLRRIGGGALVTIYEDDENWQDFTVGAVTFTGDSADRVAHITLTRDEGRGDAPELGNGMEFHFTPAGQGTISAPVNLVGSGTFAEASFQVQRNTFDITWDEVEGADSYRLRFTPDRFGDGGVPSIRARDTNSFPSSAATLSSVIGVREYQIEVWSVQTVDGEEFVAGPSIITITLTNSGATTAPGVPAISVGMITQTTARMNITAPSSWGSGSTSSRKYKGNSRVSGAANWGTENTLDDSQTFLDITGLTAGTSYDLRLKSFTDDGESSYVTATFMTLTANALSVPTLTGTPGDGQVSLSYTTVTGGTYYDIRRRVGTTGIWSTIRENDTDGAHTDTNVTNGTLYQYSVRAKNQANSNPTQVSAWSTPISVTPSSGGTPPPQTTNPSNLQMSEGNSGLWTGSWTAASGYSGRYEYEWLDADDDSRIGGGFTTNTNTGILGITPDVDGVAEDVIFQVRRSPIGGTAGPWVSVTVTIS